MDVQSDGLGGNKRYGQSCWVSDNTDVAGKQAMVETAVLAATVMNALGDAMPADL